MAHKMKGFPMMDTSSKHGTNANYKKSGAPLMGKLGEMAGNFIKGKGPMGFMNPIGAIANRMGAFGNKGGGKPNVDPNAMASNTPPTVIPPQPEGPAPVVDPNAGVSGQGTLPVE